MVIARGFICSVNYAFSDAIKDMSFHVLLYLILFEFMNRYYYKLWLYIKIKQRLHFRGQILRTFICDLRFRVLLTVYR